jgi:hypothetical protein
MTPLDAVEPFEPPHHYYCFKEGAWVNFRQSRDCKHHTWQGYVKDVVDMYTIVIDKCTFTKVSDQLYSQEN